MSKWAGSKTGKAGGINSCLHSGPGEASSYFYEKNLENSIKLAHQEIASGLESVTILFRGYLKVSMTNV